MSASLRKLIGFWCPVVGLLTSLIAIAALMAAQPVSADPVSFTVLTYNIRAGLGSAEPDRNPQEARGKRIDLAPVVAAIKSTNADIVALQEVVGDAQARTIATMLGMSYVYARHGETYGNWWGLAILSKFPIEQYRSIPTSHGRGNTRSDLLAVIWIGASKFTIVNVHVDKDVKDGSPIGRTLATLDMVHGPVAVLGDFNARPRTERLAPIRERLSDVADVATANGAAVVRRHPTFTRDGQAVAGARIDYIFVDRTHVEVREVAVLSPAHWKASDHIGVLAVLAPKARQ